MYSSIHFTIGLSDNQIFYYHTYQILIDDFKSVSHFFSNAISMSEMNDNDESLELESLIELIPIDDEEGILFAQDVDTYTIAEEHPYINTILESSKLHVLQENKVKSNYENYGVGGLFRLFLKDKFLDGILQWTNDALTKDARHVIDKQDLYMYISLEIGMSLVGYNQIKDFWAEGLFLGHDDFKNAMSRNRFSEIRSHIKIHPPFMDKQDPNINKNDPLWHSRFLLNHILQNFASTAVPLGASAIDESGIGCKAQSQSVSFCPAKPDKYAIRFYSLVGHKYKYLFSIQDCGVSKLKKYDGYITPLNKYISVFPRLKTPVSKVFTDTGDITNDDASALWATQIGHMTMQAKSSSVNNNASHRYVFCDNFYTRHTLATAIDTITDGEVKVTGTIRTNYVESVNR